MSENQTSEKLKSLWLDNWGEYKFEEFVKFCQEHGIRREYMTPYSLQQNGIAKWMNRKIQEQIVAMLHHSGFLDGFWAEALITAMHIINM